MKNSEIIQLTDKELMERIEDEKDLYVKLKLNHAVSPLDNPTKISNTRKDIARLKTELSRRNIENDKKS